jgi:hypothetical protein
MEERQNRLEEQWGRRRQFERSERIFRVPIRRPRPDIQPTRGSSDPARVAGRPGGLQRHPGRPGTDGRATRHFAELRRVNRAVVPVDPPLVRIAQRSRF